MRKVEVFQDYAYYYNLFYKDKDYVKETNQISKLLHDIDSKIHSIINYGCGTGQHDLELVKLGYQCTGIDISPLMIKIATENAKNAKVKIDFSVADIREFVPHFKYDAVISLFHVMSYQNTNQDIYKTFSSARKSLEKNGIFLFDVWYGPGVLSDKPCVRVKEIEDNENKLIRIAKPIMHDKDNVVDVCYEIFVINKNTNKVKVINEVHHMRYFFKPELEYILSETGFELLDVLDCRSLEDTNYNTWTSYFIAKAK